MTTSAVTTAAVAWTQARAMAYRAGRSAMGEPVDVPLAEADGLTLASALTTLTDLPAFPTSSVDGYAGRGAGPWRVVGQVLAGSVPGPVADGEAVEIATGAMVPDGTTQIIRIEEATHLDDGRVDGRGRPMPDFRDRGDEAAKGEELLAAGVAVTPGLLGLAAACGYDTIPVVPAVPTALVVFGDELLTAGPPGAGRVRDSLGPQVPGWLRRLGADPRKDLTSGPVEDTLGAHVEAIRSALEQVDLVCTTGGTMHGPVDHLHPALHELGARYVANTVAVRPGFPMLLAEIPGPRPRFVAGLPGNPQSAIIALMTLVAPLLAGLSGRAEPVLPTVTLGDDIHGRGDHTHLALARLDAEGLARPVSHVGSAMLRGLAGADGFAVIAPGTHGRAGDRVPMLALPLLPGERP